MVGVTWWNFYFRLFPDAIRSRQIIGFLFSSAAAHFGQAASRLGRAAGHRSRAEWDFVPQQRGRLWLHFLPAYAPELNPVEYLLVARVPELLPTTVG